MLKVDQLESLYTAINCKQENLHKISERFQATYQENPSLVFRMYCALVHFLLLNILTKQQRLVGLFLLLEACLIEDVRHSPFGHVLFYMFDKTNEPYEKLLIHDLLVMGRRDKIAKIRLPLLMEDYELAKQDTGVLSPQFEFLRKEVIDNLPKLPIGKAIEVRTVLSNFPSPPNLALTEEPLKIQKLSVKQLDWQGFSTSFVRPLPAYLPIHDSELEWLSPGIITDVIWDNSSQISGQLQRAESTVLNKSQLTQLLAILQRSPCILSGESLKNSDFAGLFSRNPQIAMYILQTKPEHQLPSLYDKLINIELTKTSLEHMRKLILERDVPLMTVNYYIIKTLQKCEAMSDEVSQDRFARMIISLIKQLIKSKKLDPKEIQAEIRSFGIRLCQVDQVAKLYKRFAENNSK